MPYEKIESAIRGQKPELMEDLEYVTTYRGKPLGKRPEERDRRDGLPLAHAYTHRRAGGCDCTARRGCG